MIRRRAAAAARRLTRAASRLPANAKRYIALQGAQRAGRRSLLVGPANMAGQGWHIARAVERHLKDVDAECFMAERNRSGYEFRADYAPSGPELRGDLVRHRARVLDGRTHVLFESARPVLANFKDSGGMVDDLPELTRHGIASGVLLHGSEIRDPRLHRKLYATTPFTDLEEDLTARLVPVAERVRRSVDEFEGIRLVTTPDLLDFVDGATWLPLVISAAPRPRAEPALTRRRPIVLHAPTNSLLKGSAYIDPVLDELDALGAIEYRRVTGMPHDELLSLMSEADVVVDQIMIGSYGVLALESMAAGCATIVNVAPHVRARVGGHLPTIDVTPDTVRQTVEAVLDDRSTFASRAEAGPAYVMEHHDGRRTAAVVAPFLGTSVSTTKGTTR